MALTATNRAPTNPNDDRENNSHYLHLRGQNSAASLSFAIGWEMTILKRIFSELSMFPIVKDGDSSTTAIPLADYRMILTSQTIEALSH